jgi:histone H3/H4
MSDLPRPVLRRAPFKRWVRSKLPRRQSIRRDALALLQTSAETYLTELLVDAGTVMAAGVGQTTLRASHLEAAAAIKER